MSNPTPTPPKGRGVKPNAPSVPPVANGQSHPVSPSPAAPASVSPPAGGSPPVAPPPPAPAQSPDPATTPDTDDPGDETNRNFRYQHAYGVILLAAAFRGERPYVALWCEHHEDFLAQCQDGRYDGYQVKTSRPENGAWQMHDSEVVRSIGRFVDLVRQFGSRIRSLFFVSNTAFDHCGDNVQERNRVRRRPRAFLTHVRGCADHTAVAAPYADTFTEIQAACGCQPEELFTALQRMDLVNGPPRESFHPVVAHQHLTRLPDCGALPAAELDDWCNSLIARVCAASSLAVTDPIQHLVPLIDNGGVDPVLVSKRLVVAEVMARPTPAHSLPFEFSGDPALAIGGAARPEVLQAKLEQGELADQVDYLRGRQRDAEYHLLEQAARSPEHFPRLLRRLEEVVLGECSEAHLRARMQGAPYGPSMMVDVQERLRRIAREEPARVGNQSYDCLMGMVGLLTSDTRVWWSPRFPVQEAPT